MLYFTDWRGFTFNCRVFKPYCYLCSQALEKESQSVQGYGSCRCQWCHVMNHVSCPTVLVHPLVRPRPVLVPPVPCKLGRRVLCSFLFWLSVPSFSRSRCVIFPTMYPVFYLAVPSWHPSPLGLLLRVLRCYTVVYVLVALCLFLDVLRFVWSLSRFLYILAMPPLYWVLHATFCY